MNIQDAFYHARIVHIRNVLTALGPVRVAKGMTAFDDGQSNWSHCFFARAFAGELDLHGRPEVQLKEALKLPSIVPIRFVWRAFDSAASAGMKRAELKAMIEKLTTQDHDDAVDKFLASIAFDEAQPVELVCD